MSHPTISIVDPLPGRREHEPIFFTVPGDLPDPLWAATTSNGEQVLCQRVGSSPEGTRFVSIVSFEGGLELALDSPVTAPDGFGISTLDPIEDDAFVRLDTGYFDIELCQGTAQGTGASKWGIRHFRTLSEDIDLLPSGNNAIGGFYGPFFTPENGLINPPEHTIVTIETVATGPLYHHYRFHGVIPDGLLPELRGKEFSIDWKFTYRTAWFARAYNVTPFETIINGRSITDKITVGDEFEGGQGTLVFDRFATYGGTRYRAGDPYAGELASMVEETLRTSREESEKFQEFSRLLGGDLEDAHWDLYWRLFCTWEGALSDDEIRERLAHVRKISHVAADRWEDRPWILTEEPIDVSQVPHETIFPGPASKSVEYHSENGRAMVWWTSQPSGAFQIVQRRQSGWVNWGSNGENECPELPVGVDIKTAYGQIQERWEQVADQLETPPVLTVSAG